MKSMDMKLLELSRNKKDLNVAIVGAGKMGKGLINQMSRINGMIPRVVCNRTPEKAIDAYLSSGVNRNQILLTNSLTRIEEGIMLGKYIVTEYIDLVSRINCIDAIVDATGDPEAGAKLSLDAIENGKHIIMLNVEADSVVGPILYEKARKNNIVYTGTAGDEPGSVMELYNFAVSLGFDVLAVGKGKNNPVNLQANPDIVREEALKKGLKPSMLAGFVDGTNTMIEMTCMSNATGFLPDISGGHGIESNIDDLTGKMMLKEEGGLLNNYKIVDYVLGIAPGVFVIFTTDLEEVHSQLEFLSMGSGPNYVLYRPFHLTSLETPITIFDACINNSATIAPVKGQVSDTVALAKKDLRAGDYLDYIGGYTFYGSIEKHDDVLKKGYVPVSLINKNTKVLKDIKAGEYITNDMVELDKTTTIYRLRKEQDKILG